MTARFNCARLHKTAFLRQDCTRLHKTVFLQQSAAICGSMHQSAQDCTRLHQHVIHFMTTLICQKYATIQLRQNTTKQLLGPLHYVLAVKK